MILIAPGVTIVDVSGALPVHRVKRWGRRQEAIQRLYVHHSGALGRASLAGFQASAAYDIRAHDWAGSPYHFWAPREPVRTGGALTLFRGNADDRHTFHTGGKANGHGLALALQGNTSVLPLSDSQIEILEAWIPWALEANALALPALSWHSESAQYGGSGKKACPGKAAEAWLRSYRGS
jgi:hypothetical protein